jgi:hypothetical protein
MKPAALASLVGAALIGAGCAPYERQDTSESRTVELGGAQSARVQVDMGAGELRIDGSGSKLLDAEFHYSAVEWKPQIKYDVTGSRGYLTVRQPPIHGFNTGNQENRWNLSLNDRIPLDLHVNLGAGQGTFKLSGMAVRRLEVDIGAGEVQVDLTGPWEQDLDGRIQGGVGEATVRLPREVGVRVEAMGGIGGIRAEGLRKEGHYYFNDAYGKSNVRLRLSVTGGIGQINLIG